MAFLVPSSPENLMGGSRSVLHPSICPLMILLVACLPFELHTFGFYLTLLAFALICCGLSSPSCQEKAWNITKKMRTLSILRPSDETGRLAVVKATERSRDEAQKATQRPLAQELEEIVRNTLPKDEDANFIRRITAMTKKCILPIVPQAEITAFAYVNLHSNDVDRNCRDYECHVVVKADPDVLAAALKAHAMKMQQMNRRPAVEPDSHGFKKYATKVLSERLTFVKFWRSMFSARDPEVVFMVPEQILGSRNPLRMNFSVNAFGHLRLFTMHSKANLRTKELITLVVEWATRRGLTRTTKGHAPPYAWCVMATYFINCVQERKQAEEESTLIETFRRFVNYLLKLAGPMGPFLCITFSPSDQVADMVAEAERRGVPFIEDPFEGLTNVADTLTADAVSRWREEFCRAATMLANESTTAFELLERWAPPDDGPQ